MSLPGFNGGHDGDGEEMDCTKVGLKDRMFELESYLKNSSQPDWLEEHGQKDHCQV